MADYVIDQTRKAEVLGVNIDRASLLDQIGPRYIDKGNGNYTKVRRPPHQASGTESAWFLQSFPPNLSNTSAFATTGLQDAGAMFAQWQLKAQPLVVRQMAIEFTVQWPSDADNAYPGFMPGQLWLDRIEFAFDNNYAIQRLYMDMSFMYLCGMLTPEKLKTVADQNGNWMAPYNAPGVTQLTAPGTDPYVAGGPNNAAWNFMQQDSMANFPHCIYPFQPHTSMNTTTIVANGPRLPNTLTSTYYTMRVYFTGSFIDQAGLIDLQWIGGGTLFITAYSAGRPHYNTAINGTAAVRTEPVISNINLLCECLSVPRDEHLTAFHNAYLGEGIFLLYLWYIRVTGQPLPANVGSLTDPYTHGPAAGTQWSSILLDPAANLHVSHIVMWIRNKAAFTGTTSNGWLLGTSCQGYYRQNGYTNGGSSATTFAAVAVRSTSEPIPDPAQSCFNGVHTALGDLYASSPAGMPAIDIVDTGALKLFSSDTMTVERSKFLTNNIAANPLQTIGRKVGLNTYSPFFTNMFPMFFLGSPFRAARGYYDGSMTFPLSYKFQITYGSNADSSDGADIYFCTWKLLRIGQKNQKWEQLSDPAKSSGAIARSVKPVLPAYKALGYTP